MRRALIASNARVRLFTSIQLHFGHQPVRGGNSLSPSPMCACSDLDQLVAVSADRIDLVAGD